MEVERIAYKPSDIQQDVRLNDGDDGILSHAVLCNRNIPSDKQKEDDLVRSQALLADERRLYSKRDVMK